ncbi:MAG: pyridoxal-phosphate dependent enzyme [Deltaproteobacteria bacterium]|nr:pyridoxal-phosphate dependent enzyme [Deltaproteobacteria bacterium]
MKDFPSFDDIRQAAQRIKPHVHRTPILTCESLDRISGCKLFFKPENLQKVGAFKFRGATNAVFSLSDKEAAQGVATHSSGNHAAALALAASRRGTKAHIIMPQNAPAIKKSAVLGYGAEITFCEPTLKAREDGLNAVVEKTGAVIIHPYNDPLVIAGQGTAALELIEDVPDLDAVIAPVGGGGLMSGTALAISALAPRVRIIGAEPSGADDACRSLQAGRIIPSQNPTTIADGLLTSLGSLTFPILHKHLERIVTVSEQAIISAMRQIWERMKLVIEPSSAVPLAAIQEGQWKQQNIRIGVILSGGNVNLDELPWVK